MRILQVFRAPFGGLFRHVLDLAKAQSQLGHEIGLICDSTTGGETAKERLKQLEPYCSLGINRIEMSRLPGLGDAISARRVAEFARDKGYDIIHGHGAKGGAYARFAAGRIGAKAIYTAHGGSLHYNWNSPSGALFLGVERMLLTRTDGLVFVCDYERRTFDEKIGIGPTSWTVVLNGLWPHEFEPAVLGPDPTDILYVGELRNLKGVDVLLKAIAAHDNLTATIVGDGVDRQAFEDLSAQLGLQTRVKFTGAMPAHEAFGLGTVMVIPSRAESFPYIVLEAIAAHKPIVASDVGGIGEVLPNNCMVEPDNPGQLLEKICKTLGEPETAAREARDRAEFLKTHKNGHHMAADICRFYEECLRGTGTCSNVA